MGKLRVMKLNSGFMKKNKINFTFILISLILLINTSNTSAQNKSEILNFSLSGYLQNFETVWIQNNNGKWQTMNAINNRLDLKWYPTNSVTAHIGMRNIFNYGQLVADYYPYFADMAIRDKGFIDMTRSIVKDTSCFLYTNIDRAYFEFVKGNLEIKIGKQRINWGKNLVWTPNDIFNTFNYFDFDYIERPGCDAIKVQYYTGMTSSAQLAYKIDKDKKVTFAGMYSFNKWNYDFQFLGGIMEDDIAIGAGWAGQLFKAGFNGEATYFRDKENFADTTGIFVASIGLNYTFKNSIFIHGAFLYNSAGTTDSASMGTMMAMDMDISAKNFTRARYSTFAQISFPVSPLIKASLSGIFNPNDKSAFVGPSMDISLTDNIGFLITGQIFMGDDNTEFGDYGTLLFARLKWSF